MRSEADYQPVSVETRRLPLLRRVTLLYQGEDVPVEEMGINVSMMGMFVRTDSPRAVGSLARFSLTLADGEKPIEGAAEVVWSRGGEEGVSEPPGMGMRFLKVSGEGRRRIREAVESLVEETSAPAELRDLRLVVEKTLEEIFAARDQDLELKGEALSIRVSSETESGASVADSVLESKWRGRRKLLFFLALTALLIAGLGFVVWTPESSSSSRGIPPNSVSKSYGEQKPAPVDAPAGPEEPSGQTGEKVGEKAGISDREQAEQIQSMLATWATAWSQQRVEDYLAYYAPEYRPLGNVSREEWADQRRARIAAPEFIQVSIVDLDIRVQGENRAEAEFLQSYRSDRYRDSVRKALELVRREGRWQILAERNL